MGNAFALTSAAVHECWVTAHLYGEQISIGVIAVTKTCCEPVLQSSTEQWELHFALTRHAVHWCCLTANLYEQQTSIFGVAVAQKPAVSLFCRAALNSGECNLPKTLLQYNSAASLHTCMESKSP